MYQFDCLLRSLFGAECDESIASVETAERVHHQTQVPDRPRLLKQWHQLIFKQVSGDLTHKNLKWERKGEETS